MNLGEFMMETLNPVADMYGGSHPLLRGRGAALVPVADGFTPPAFYDWLLWPFSDNKVPALTTRCANWLLWPFTDRKVRRLEATMLTVAEWPGQTGYATLPDWQRRLLHSRQLRI